MKSNGIFYGRLEFITSNLYTYVFYCHLVITDIRDNLYIFPRFGKLYQEKSGNPGSDRVVMDLIFSDLIDLLIDTNEASR
jgi:hypothetical protein